MAKSSSPDLFLIDKGRYIEQQIVLRYDSKGFIFLSFERSAFSNNELLSTVEKKTETFKK